MREVVRYFPPEDDQLPTGRADPRIAAAIRRWAMISARIQELEKQKEALRQELLDWAENHGRVDSNGHQHVTLPEPIRLPNGKTLSGIIREKRVSRAFNEERVQQIAAEKGLTGRFYRQETVTYLDPDEIYRAYQEGLLTEEEVDSLIDTTIKYAMKGA